MEDLDAFFNPKTVAVVGVSQTPGKIGNVIFSNFLESNFEGNVYPVNPYASIAYGKKVHLTVKDIPERVDPAVTAVRAEVTPQVVADCTEKGIRGIIIVSGGFSETSREGREREETIVRMTRAKGIRVVGPNLPTRVNPSFIN